MAALNMTAIKFVKPASAAGNLLPPDASTYTYTDQVWFDGVTATALVAAGVAVLVDPQPTFIPNAAFAAARPGFEF